jgi:hypothetical protein
MGNEKETTEGYIQSRRRARASAVHVSMEARARATDDPFTRRDDQGELLEWKTGTSIIRRQARSNARMAPSSLLIYSLRVS